MARYAVICTIDETRLALFGGLRAAHYEFLLAAREQIVFGGPTRTLEGGRPETMIIVVEAESLAAARAFIAAEPYNRAGGFSEVLVRPWSQVLPEVLPGALRRVFDEETAKRPLPDPPAA